VTQAFIPGWRHRYTYQYREDVAICAGSEYLVYSLRSNHANFGKRQVKTVQAVLAGCGSGMPDAEHRECRTASIASIFRAGATARTLRTTKPRHHSEPMAYRITRPINE
jgi:hypothetical protein